MTGIDEDQGRSRRLSVEDWGWSGIGRVLGGWMFGRSGDAMCVLHRPRGGDEKHRFLDLPSKPVVIVWWFGPQNHHDGFVFWASKPWSMGWWFGPQNHHDGFLVCASNSSGWRIVGLHLKTDEWMKMVWGHASTFGGLLHHEVSWARVSQFYLKTGEKEMMGGARGIIVEVTWKWSKRWPVWWRRECRSGSQINLPFISCNFPFSPQGHSSLLVFAINRTIGLLWEVSLSHPLGLRSSFF
jgi:hypothetical protein